MNHESEVLKSKDDELKSEKLELIKLRAEKKVLSTQVDIWTELIFKFVVLIRNFENCLKLYEKKTNIKYSSYYFMHFILPWSFKFIYKFLH